MFKIKKGEDLKLVLDFFFPLFFSFSIFKSHNFEEKIIKNEIPACLTNMCFKCILCLFLSVKVQGGEVFGSG